MSARKRNKLKKIIKKDHILKTIFSALFCLLFVIIAYAVLFFYTLNIIDRFIIKSDEDINTVVEFTNNNWKEIQKNPSQLDYLKEQYHSIYQIAFLDDNFFEILSDGISVPKFKSSDFSSNSPSEILSETGMFKEGKIEFNPFGFNNFVQFPKFSAFIKLNKNKNFLEWSEKEIPVISQWIVYKTDIENVNVCVKYIYLLNNNDFVQILLIVLTAANIALIFNFFLVIFIISIIRRSAFSKRIIYTDSITGGNNKDYFIDIALKKAKRNTNYAVIHFRLEKYRNYCIAYGLKNGEILLESIDHEINNYLHRREFLAHIEKADFALLLKYDTKEQLEERLRKMNFDFNQNNKGQHINFAAGICTVQSKKDDMSFILNAAGLALSKAENSTSHIVWFNEEMKEEQLWERRVEDNMEKGIQNQEFQVYLQPKYSTKKEEIAAAEALVRWIHPELGFISPGKFIPIFEKNGFILELDDYMLKEISKLQAKWLSEGKKLVPISVNVSRAHFSIENLAEHICSIVDEYKVPHEFIELELTESAFFDDKSTLLNTVKKLKSYNFKISMDDFGAGYSSLNSLKELPLDIIKLDAEFFRGIDDINRANAIVSDTIALAKKLGMEIVAEGIETREQVDFLAAQNCDLIQGFYFAKPLPVNEFIERAYGEKSE